jgi:hypothetical protein
MGAGELPLQLIALLSFMEHDGLLTLSVEDIEMTTHAIFAAAAALGFFVLTSVDASAVECVAGVHR